MKRKSIRLTIPEPCSEDWNKMTDTAKGKFCGSCQKNLVDFSVMKDEEIINWMKNQKGQVCGRLRHDQMNRNLQIEVQRKSNWKIMPYLFSLFLLFNKKEIQAQNNPPSIVTIEPKIDTIPDLKKQRKEILQINGRVTDSHTNEELLGATVVLHDGKTGTTADINGKFILNIPETYTQEVIEITVRYIGFKDKLVRIERNNIASFYDIKMEEYETLGFIGIIEAPPPKWKFWKRRRYRH